MNAHTTVSRPIDPVALRDTLGCFATGVAIVTGIKPNGEPVGLTISSFNSLSLDPPLVLWSLSKASASQSAFGEDRPFIINILSGKQRDVCLKFARSAADKFADVSAEPGICGVLALDDSIAQMECITTQVIVAGDHILYIGQVTDLRIASDDAPLVFHRSKLTVLQNGAGG